MAKKRKADPSVTTAVKQFLARANAGIEIEELGAELAALYHGRYDEEMEAWIFAKDGVKKIVDEIAPVSRMLAVAKIKVGKVRFPLNCKTPDCYLIRKGKKAVEIEVTISQGRERLVLARERMANPRGITRGRVGLTDDASEEEVANTERSRRAMSTPGRVIDVFVHSVRLCLAKKADRKYSGMWLVIAANMPPKSLMPRLPDMKPNAVHAPFERVYVVGRVGDDAAWLRLK